MNIYLNPDSVRIRLTDTEYSLLGKNGKLITNFDYWPLEIKINVLLSNQISKVSATKVEINLVSGEVEMLADPKLQKSGLSILAMSDSQQELLINLQLDLHKNK